MHQILTRCIFADQRDTLVFNSHLMMFTCFNAFRIIELYRKSLDILPSRQVC